MCYNYTTLQCTKSPQVAEALQRLKVCSVCTDDTLQVYGTPMKRINLVNIKLADVTVIGRSNDANGEQRRVLLVDTS